VYDNERIHLTCTAESVLAHNIHAYNLLMYKTEVYTLIIDAITHQKPQI